MPQHRLLILWLGGVFALGPVAAQTNAPSTNAAATNAPAAAAPVALADVVTEAMSESAHLQNLREQLAADTTVATVKASLPTVTAQIDRQETADDTLLKSSSSLTQLHAAQAAWQSLGGTLDDAKEALTARIALLDASTASLGQMNTRWQATLTSSAGAPAAVLDRIHGVIGEISDTTQAVGAARTNLLLLQNEVAEQDTRVAAAITAIRKAQGSALDLLLHRDSAPVWDLAGFAQAPVSPEDSFAAQAAATDNYIAEKFPVFFLHLVLFLAIAGFIFWARGQLRRVAGTDPEMRQATVIFEVPLATSLVLALLLALWLYPVPPVLFQAVLGALAMAPAILILRRLIEPGLFPLLYALVIAFLLDHLRLVVVDATTAGRILFLAELVAACLFFLWLLRSRRREARVVGPDARLETGVRIYGRCALVLAAAALLANAFGYGRLSSLLASGLCKSSYLLAILYAAVRIGDGLIVGALKLPPFSLTNMVRHHAALLRRRSSLVLRGVVLFFWVWKTFDLLSLRAPVLAWIGRALNDRVSLGAVPLSLKPLLCFGLTIWATVLLSRFLRFVLEEEVYPKLHLGRGVPYAASTLVHYTVLVLGTLFALATMGIDLRQYSVLAGALGVGLGFGLQNITNNFVSGIILLFERPIKVGDVIQIDTNGVGTVESIGIRASIIRLTNGSEYIVPNGNLISNPVTNWTFSNRQRVVDLPVAVASKSDPEQVMNLLVAAARAHPLVLKDPAPRVLLTSFTGAVLNFELRAWVGGSENWLQVRSELALAVSAALARANIAMT